MGSGRRLAGGLVGQTVPPMGQDRTTQHGSTTEAAGTTPRAGAHVSRRGWQQETLERGGDVAQIFLGNPRSWAAATPLGEAERADTPLPHWVHTTYLANVCSENPEVRQRSVAALTQTLEAAAESGSSGVVVHAGQGGNQTIDETIRHWADTIGHLAETLQATGMLLCVENTASGKVAPGRETQNMARLAETLKESGEQHEVAGQLAVCLDTCHSWAAGWHPEDHRRIAEMIRVPIVHLNGSRDPWGSGRDRHANLQDADSRQEADSRDPNRIPASWLQETLAAIQALGPAHLVCETPGGAEAQRADIETARQLAGT